MKKVSRMHSKICGKVKYFNQTFGDIKLTAVPVEQGESTGRPWSERISVNI